MTADHIFWFAQTAQFTAAVLESHCVSFLSGFHTARSSRLWSAYSVPHTLLNAGSYLWTRREHEFSRTVSFSISLLSLYTKAFSPLFNTFSLGGCSRLGNASHWVYRVNEPWFPATICSFTMLLKQPTEGTIFRQLLSEANKTFHFLHGLHTLLALCFDNLAAAPIYTGIFALKWLYLNH